MNATVGERRLYATFRYEELTQLERPEEKRTRWSGEVETICTILDEEDRVITTGSSRKSPQDQFSRKIGRQIALGRAVWTIYPHDAVKRHELLRQFLSK